MKKCISALFVVVFTLVACSKDDTPLPEPPKVTQITCTKNGSSLRQFDLEIRYNTEGKVANVTDHVDNVTYNYQYRDNKIYVLSLDGYIYTEYTLSGDRMTAYTLSDDNPYNANEKYIRDKYTYDYNGAYWVNTGMEGNRLSATGELRPYGPIRSNKFTWTKGNLTEYISGDYNVMKFEYGSLTHPANFPYRILNSIPTEFTGSMIQKENFSPLNFLRGSTSKNLLEKAYWYTIPETDTILGKYDFDYETDGYGYVTKVYVTETIYFPDSTQEEVNNYTFTLVYGYDPNKNK